MNKIFGLRYIDVLVTTGVGVVVMLFVRFGYGIGTCLVITTAFHLYEMRRNRSEAAWEISANGTKQLWNDGPKSPLHKQIK